MAEYSHYRVYQDRQVPEIDADVVREANKAPYLQDLKENLKIQVTKLDEESIEFDVIGVDAAIANALRRILLSEVPTVAVEHVWIAINSSIIHDEVLAHRVGLVPIRVDPSKLDWVVGEEETDRDTIVFHYDVECKLDGESVVNSNALSGAFSWLPQGNQEEVFPDGVKPVHEDIVLAKLAPGQRIEFEAHCRKGIGKDHVKYSPVATAHYRLLPEITFLEDVLNEKAVELVETCPMKVFDIEDIGKKNSKQKRAYAARPRDCTMCRECIRKEGWSERVRLSRVKEHFLFSVESTGVLAPETIVREAVRVLKEKALKFQGLVDEYMENN